jgi:hypothetical protein
MARKVHKWDDWSGGEYGILRPEDQKKNEFTGTNMLLYDDGRVGPRSGIAVTAGVGGGALVVNGSEAVGYANITNADWVVYAGTNVYTWDVTANVWRVGSGSIGTSSGEAAVFVRTASDTNYLLARDNGLYRVVHTGGAGPTVTSITVSAFTWIGSAISLYRDRMYISDVTTTARVRYSAVNDYTSWTAADYFDVGDNTKIAWMGWSGGRLIIIKENLEIWAYQGTPGQDSLVRLNEAQVPGGFNGRCVTTAKNGDIWAWKPGKAYPHKLVGNRFVGQRHLSLFPDGGGTNLGPTSSVGSMSGTHEDDGIFGFVRSGGSLSADENRWGIAIRRNSAWSFHYLTAGFVGVGIIASKSDGSARSLILTGNSVVSAYQFAHVNNKPTLSGDPYGTSGEDALSPVACTFDTSTYIVSGPNETRVNKVIIEFDSPTVVSAGFVPTISDVHVVGLDADGEEFTLDFGSWTHASGGRVGGYRVVFTSDGDIPMTQFRVHLALYNIVIKSIQVLMEEDDVDIRG